MVRPRLPSLNPAADVRNVRRDRLFGDEPL